MLKENGYQESIINKVFKGITNNHILPQSQQESSDRDQKKFIDRESRLILRKIE